MGEIVFIPLVVSSSSTSEDFFVRILPFSTRLNPRVPDPIIPAQDAPSTSHTEDLSSLQENGSSDVVVDQATVDNSTNASIDQMPIVEFIPPVASSSSTSEDFFVRLLPFSTRLNPRVPDTIIPAQDAPSASHTEDFSSPQENGSSDVVVDQATVDNSTNASIDQMPINEFIPPVASSSSTLEDFFVRLLPFSTRLNPRVPDPIIPAQDAPSTSHTEDFSSPQENGSSDVVVDQATVDNTTNASIDQMPINESSNSIKFARYDDFQRSTMVHKSTTVRSNLPKPKVVRPTVSKPAVVKPIVANHELRKPVGVRLLCASHTDQLHLGIATPLILHSL
ncbi:hypothetical protein L1987_15160 [Smallanthus sonchifolius]|uniref:Uncharacterized protein n=1 Tax=Smallanthus sonchifolius TaxID=185202 RepID=A0ACB9J721_9ASTR|nr:hypothetical protein L1987_15160 [Smallanthus sonchifolius]